MAWWLTKGGAFIVNSFYSSLVGRFLKSFAIGIVWNPLVSMRVNFFCVGSSLRKNSNSRSTKKDGLVFSCLPSRCYFCKGEESQQTIYYSIVQRRPFCDTLSLHFLMFNG